MAAKKKGASDKDPAPKKTTPKKPAAKKEDTPKKETKKKIGEGVSLPKSERAVSNNARANMLRLKKEKEAQEALLLSSGVSAQQASDAAEIARLAQIESLKGSSVVPERAALDEEDAAFSELTAKRALEDKARELSASKLSKGNKKTYGGRTAFRALPEARKSTIMAARENTRKIIEAVKPARRGREQQAAEDAVVADVIGDTDTSTLVPPGELKRRQRSQARAAAGTTSNRSRTVRQQRAVSANVPKRTNTAKPVSTTRINPKTLKRVPRDQAEIDREIQARKDKAAEKSVIAGANLPLNQVEGIDDNAMGNVATADTASRNFNRGGEITEVTRPSAQELSVAGISISSDRLNRLMYGDPQGTKSEKLQSQNFWSQHPVESFFHPDAGNVDSLKLAHERPDLLKPENREAAIAEGISPELHEELGNLTPEERHVRYEDAAANAPDKNAYDKFKSVIEQTYREARQGTRGSTRVAGIEAEKPIEGLSHEKATEMAYKAGLAEIQKFQTMNNRGALDVSQAIKRLRKTEEESLVTKKDVAGESEQVIDPKQFEGLDTADISALILGGQVRTTSAPLNTVLSRQLFVKGAAPGKDKPDERPVSVKGTAAQGRSVLSEGMPARLQQQLRDNPVKAQRHLGKVAREAVGSSLIVPHNPITGKSYGDTIQGAHFIEDPHTGTLAKVNMLAGMQTSAMDQFGELSTLTEDHPSYDPKLHSQHIGAPILKIDPDKAYLASHADDEESDDETSVSLHRKVTTNANSNAKYPNLPTLAGAVDDQHLEGVRKWQEAGLRTNPSVKEEASADPYMDVSSDETGEAIKRHTASALGLTDRPSQTMRTVNGVTFNTRGPVIPGRISQIISDRRALDTSAAESAAGAINDLSEGGTAARADTVTSMPYQNAQQQAWSEINARHDTSAAKRKTEDTNYDSDMSDYVKEMEGFDKENPGVVAREGLEQKASSIAGLSKTIANKAVQHVTSGASPEAVGLNIDDMIQQHDLGDHHHIVKDLVARHLGISLSESLIKATNPETKAAYKPADYSAHLGKAARAAAEGKDITGIESSVTSPGGVRKEVLNYLRTTLPADHPLSAKPVGNTAREVVGEPLSQEVRPSFATFRKPRLNARATAAELESVTGRFDNNPPQPVTPAPVPRGQLTVPRQSETNRLSSQFSIPENADVYTRAALQGLQKAEYVQSPILRNFDVDSKTGERRYTDGLGIASHPDDQILDEKGNIAGIMTTTRRSSLPINRSFSTPDPGGRGLRESNAPTSRQQSVMNTRQLGTGAHFGESGLTPTDRPLMAGDSMPTGRLFNAGQYAKIAPKRMRQQEVLSPDTNS